MLVEMESGNAVTAGPFLTQFREMLGDVESLDTIDFLLNVLEALHCEGLFSRKLDENLVHEVDENIKDCEMSKRAKMEWVLTAMLDGTSTITGMIQT
jgi:Glu-tRNA(Gln) amidotransferase subunit E-like FAD-binding protein